MDDILEERLIEIDNEIRMIEDILKDYENGLQQHSPTIVRPLLMENLPHILTHLKISRAIAAYEKYVREYDIDESKYITK